MQSMPCSAHKFRASDFARRVQAARRKNLHDRNELSGCQLRAELGFFRQRNTRPSTSVLDAPSLPATGATEARTLSRGCSERRFRSDQLDVLRRGAAAAADDLHSRPQHAPRVLRHVLGRAQDKCCGPPRAPACPRWAWRSEAWTNAAPAARWLRAWSWAPPSSSRPMTSTGQASISRANASTDAPPARWPKSSTATCATITISAPGRLARRKDRLAQFIQIAEGFQDQQIDAGCASATSACSRKMARASANEVGPSGSMCTPRGPIAPATNAVPRAALASQPDAGLVDVLQLFGEPKPGQPRDDWRHRCWSPESRRRPRHTRDESAAPDRATKGSVHRSSG